MMEVEIYDNAQILPTGEVAIKTNRFIKIYQEYEY